jgi:hypothetical protein
MDDDMTNDDDVGPSSAMMKMTTTMDKDNNEGQGRH